MTRRWSSGARPGRPAAAAPGEDSNGTNGEYCSGTDNTVEPNWPKMASELKRKGVTLHLLWQEYREAHPDGYGYTWFCGRFADHESRARPTYRSRHVAGVAWNATMLAIRSRSSIHLPARSAQLRSMSQF